MTTAYITKYSLSGKDAGKPITANGRVRNGYDGKKDEYFSCKMPGWWHEQSFKIGRDVFLTKEEAISDIDARRVKKIASLNKQIAKLEALKVRT